MLIKNGTVFTKGTSFEKKEIEIEGIQIKSLHAPGEAASGSDIYDAEGCYVIPGLVDLHFHGCVGSDISDHDLEGIRKMAAYELKSGITAICPATINPARELGIEKAHGQITEGALSNLLILDQDLNIKDIIFKGQVLSL